MSMETVEFANAPESWAVVTPRQAMQRRTNGAWPTTKRRSFCPCGRTDRRFINGSEQTNAGTWLDSVRRRHGLGTRNHESRSAFASKAYRSAPTTGLKNGLAPPLRRCRSAQLSVDGAANCQTHPQFGTSQQIKGVNDRRIKDGPMQAPRVYVGPLHVMRHDLVRTVQAPARMYVQRKQWLRV